MTRARAIRPILLLALIAGVGGVLVSGFQRPAATVAAPEKTRDGTVLRGFHSRRYEARSLVLDAKAEEIRIEAPRIGFFRLGFSRRMLARDVRLELAPAAAHRAAPFDGGRGARARETRPASAAVSSLQIDGLRVRVASGTGRALTLRAARCEASAHTGGLVLCEQVRVRGPELDQRFARVGFDADAGRLVAPGGAHSPDEAARLARVNRSLRRDDLRAIRSGLTGLTALRL